MSQPQSALVAIEKCVIGSCLEYPRLLDEAAILTAKDFRAPLLGTVLDVMREFPKRRYDLLLVAYELEKNGVVHPAAYPGWNTALNDFRDSSVPNREDVVQRVRVIKLASTARRGGVAGDFEDPRPETRRVILADAVLGPCYECKATGDWPGRICGNCRLTSLARLDHALAWFDEAKR